MSTVRVAALLLPLCAIACLDNATPPPVTPWSDDAGPVDAGSVEVGGVDAGSPIRVTTFNVHRFFDTVCQSGACAPGDYEGVPTEAQFDAQADAIAGALRTLRPDVAMIQEVETQACLDALTSRLADLLPNGVLGEIGTPASVDVAVLTSGTITQVIHHRPVLVRPDGSLTVFSRELLEVHLTLRGAKVIAFAAHFRSKVNDDPGRRLAEAQAAHDLVDAAAQANPDALVVLGGDLNDVPGSPPLQALEADGALLRVARELPTPAQATNFYDGEGEAIDHIFFATEGAGAYLPGTAQVVGGSAGYAGSDHDPLRAAFSLPR